MRAYPTQESQELFYLKDKKLSRTRESGSICILAPGDIAWESDLRALQRLADGEPADISLGTIVAKYLTNETPERG
jgi:hypothetical protein